jgi:hypothetical protein
MPEFGRLEYLTTAGWVVGHAGMALQDPQKYVDGLANRGPRDDRPPVYARFVVLDENFKPSMKFEPAEVPPPEKAGGVPITRITECAACGEPHERRFECLI